MTQAVNEQLKQELEAMTRLQQLSTRLVQVPDGTKLLEEVISAAIETTEADKGNIQLLQNGVLRIAAQQGFDRPFLDFFNEVHDGQAACGAALEKGGRVIIDNVPDSDVYDSDARKAMLGANALAVQSTPLITRSGEIIGMLSTHYSRVGSIPERDLKWIDLLARQAADLIERRRAEQALRASEERFRLAQQAAKIGVFEWNIQSGINVWSAEQEELYGLPPGSFDRTQHGWERLVHPEDREKALDKVREAITTGVPTEAEWRVIWPDGSIHWIAGRFRVDRNDEGKAARMSGVNFEITERKRIEEELRRANQDLEQFAFSASHDLQEPLRSVKIYSELLGREFAGHASEDAQRYIRYLRNGATRMESLVRDLLAYTRVTTLDQVAEIVDANEVFRQAWADLSGAVSESRAVITAEPLPDSLRIHGAHLRQLFQNLIGNAIKYRSPDRTPEVRISAQEHHGHWIFAVADNGIGIEPQFKESIFGLFRRLHTNDEYSGTGIGLAICQRIVERYHGRIWVESEPGRGSTFCFSVPL